MKETNEASIRPDIWSLTENQERKVTRNQKRKHDEINHIQKVSELDSMIIVMVNHLNSNVDFANVISHFDYPSLIYLIDLC